jgi:hypothetical protein
MLWGEIGCLRRIFTNDLATLSVALSLHSVVEEKNDLLIIRAPNIMVRVQFAEVSEVWFRGQATRQDLEDEVS